MRSFPWNSQEIGVGSDGFPDYDRAYDADDLRDMFGVFFTNGVVLNYGTMMQAYVDLNLEPMTVSVGVGACHINGAAGFVDDPETVILEPSGAEPRIDTVVLRFDSSDDVRNIYLAVVKGTPSSNPIHPVLTRNSTVWELGIADVYVDANAIEIRDENITQTVEDAGRCGYVGSFTPAANIEGVLPTAKGGTGNTDGAATKLSTARTIRTALNSTATASFDGTANITPGVSGTLAVANGGTGCTSLLGSAGLIHAMFDTAITPTYIPCFSASWADGGYASPQTLRNAMGLGNTTTAMTDFVVAQGVSGQSNKTAASTGNWYVKFNSGLFIVGLCQTVAKSSGKTEYTFNLSMPFTAASMVMISASPFSTGDPSCRIGYHTSLSGTTVQGYVQNATYTAGGFCALNCIVVGKWK